MNASSPLVQNIARILGAIGGAALVGACFSGVVVVTNSYLVVLLCWIAYVLALAMGAVAGAWLGGKACSFLADALPVGTTADDVKAKAVAASTAAKAKASAFLARFA